MTTRAKVEAYLLVCERKAAESREWYGLHREAMTEFMAAGNEPKTRQARENAEFFLGKEAAYEAVAFNLRQMIEEV